MITPETNILPYVNYVSIRKRKKRGMINMLKALMETADNMLEQMGNASKEMETLRKNQKEMLENKSIM